MLTCVYYYYLGGVEIKHKGMVWYGMYTAKYNMLFKKPHIISIEILKPRPNHWCGYTASYVHLYINMCVLTSQNT